MPAYVPPFKRADGLKKPVDRPQVSAIPEQKFDPETGQIYHEVEVLFKRKQNSDWIGELKTPGIIKRQEVSQSGSRALSDIARSKCVREFRNLTPQYFESIPWYLASRIWEEIVSIQSESFHAWRVLASVYNDAEEFGRPDHRYHLEIRQPPLPVQDYFRGITSSEFFWVAALRISTKQVTIPDLISIANIVNLSVLDLSDGQVRVDPTPCRFDERIMRAWAELASSGRAFKHLQVLMLGWQDGVYDWLFKYLDRFPNLCHVIATDCKYLHQKNRADWEQNATEHGWTAYHAKRSVKLLRPFLDDHQFHHASVSGLYYYHNNDQDEILNTQQEPNVIERLPLVECRLGTPRLWTHIIDEFPGTRTIWFERSRTRSSTNNIEPPIDKINTDTTKRTRDLSSESQAVPSPPHKKSHGRQNMRHKAPTKTAATLLADLGM